MVLVTGAALFSVAPVHAEVGIAVAPALIELEGDAGQTGSVNITVSNRGDEPFEAVTAIDVFQDMTGDHSAVGWAAARFRAAARSDGWFVGYGRCGGSCNGGYRAANRGHEGGARHARLQRRGNC